MEFRVIGVSRNLRLSQYMPKEMQEKNYDCYYGNYVLWIKKYYGEKHMSHRKETLCFNYQSLQNYFYTAHLPCHTLKDMILFKGKEEIQ